MDNDFNELEQAAWGGLLGVHGRMTRRIDADLLTHSGLSHVEFEALLRLSWADQHRLRIQDLAARSVLTRSGISRVVERLEKGGWLTRTGAKEDGRGAYAVLTAAGQTRLRAALKRHVAFVRQLFLSVFSDSELKEIAAYWERVEARLAETTEK